MIKSEVSELKKRFTIKKASFTQVAGCYVSANKEKICSFRKSFLNLPEDEIFKYLEIVGKVMSGRMNDSLLTLEFPLAEEAQGGKQFSLMCLRATGLQDDEVLESFYESVIKSYDSIENYLIILFADTYDIPVKTKDNITNDESDEIFDYFICAICPVELSKPGLSYNNSENTIEARIRDWVVGVPETGFMFPAFTERSTDIHACLFYTKDTKMPHKEFVADILGCPMKKTISIQKKDFRDAIEANLTEADREHADGIFADVQYALNEAAALNTIESGEGAVLKLSEGRVREALEDSGMKAEYIEPITQSVMEIVPDDDLIAENLIIPAAVKTGEVRSERKRLVSEIREKDDQIAAITCRDSDDSVRIYIGDTSDVEVREINGELCVLIHTADREVIVNDRKVN